ncbi:glycerophosphodiester phosphodiesterase GDPD4 isoform X2 [Tripterygium wilfordii]|uniref:glycerophosphodiester phosphodiesterase GDPD4 isoform X2 n=1 Tax=Tripterygium wilfordii TaxID=458696 RepID=UPI0018F7F9FF|nr:glycerophosphodiester phosphodiesterase GDPD4 isoform X2 [Tripterygium wilfordii]
MAIAGSMRRRQQQLPVQRQAGVVNRFPFRFRFTSRRALRFIVVSLACVALFPPIFFHFRLRHFRQMQLRKCGWLNDPPLVCAHGGDATNAFPNTMAAYGKALHSQVDCIEIDVSRSSDGVLFALHDRDLQQMSRNITSRVGYLSTKEIKELNASHWSARSSHDQTVPTLEDALMIKRAHCLNCLVWAKIDDLALDVIKLSSDVTVGYIVMLDPSTGTRSNLLRMKGARVVGVYHPLIDEKLVKILHGRNKKVYGWTVDDADSMQRMLYERVDGVVTSNPTLFQRTMQDVRTQCLEEGFSLA